MNHVLYKPAAEVFVRNVKKKSFKTETDDAYVRN